MTIQNATFSGNRTPDTFGSGAGLANSNTDMMLQTAVFSGNIASRDGGGIDIFDGTQTISDVTFIRNRANGGRGGGLIVNNTSPLIQNSTFVGNFADGRGGGLGISSGSPTLQNVVFSGNRSIDDGGAIGGFDFNPNMQNVTISGNRSQGNGGGLGGFIGNPRLTNVIMGDNFAVDGDPQIESGITAVISYSLIQGGLPDGSTDAGNNLTADPLFLTSIDPFDALTTAGDLRLQADSPLSRWTCASLYSVWLVRGRLINVSIVSQSGTRESGVVHQPDPHQCRLPGQQRQSDRRRRGGHRHPHRGRADANPDHHVPGFYHTLAPA